MLLAIEACGPAGGVALGRVEGSKLSVAGQAAIPPGATSAQLIPKIRSILLTAGVTIHEVQAIAVVTGPGSFTGIRVGLGTAKGLAQGGGIPLIALSRLLLLAHVSGCGHALAAFDAGRGEYYAGEYKGRKMIWEKLLDREELDAAARRIAGGTFVVEEGTRGDFGGFRPAMVRSPDAADALRCSVEPWISRDFADLETLDGNYLRRSEKELFGAADPGFSPSGSGRKGSVDEGSAHGSSGPVE